ncbi:MAG TPA: hypothetical protein VFO85_18395, partial [Vicinamibacteria bacterium]|nr:hypothetical protein [Vicinamibacteria bacterium]
ARRAALEKQAPPPTLPPVQVASARPGPGGAVAAGPTPLPTALPSAPPAAAVDERAAVLRVIADYERAIESKDLGLYRRVWPSLTAAQEKSLRTAFEATQQQDVRITLGPIDIRGGEATVRLARNDLINGQAVSQIRQTVTLVKQGEVWTIRSIGQ